jgi:hypothetical protein
LQSLLLSFAVEVLRASAPSRETADAKRGRHPDRDASPPIWPSAALGAERLPYGSLESSVAPGEPLEFTIVRGPEKGFRIGTVRQRSEPIT